MQRFFFKNMVGVSIAVLIFTAITVGIIADQAPAPIPEDNNLNVMPPKNEQAILGDSLSGNPDPTTLPETTEAAPVELNNSLLQTLDPLEKAPDEFNPMESPEQRLVEELERLDVIPESKEEDQEVWPFQKENSGNISENSSKVQEVIAPAEPSLPTEDGMSPSVTQNEVASSPSQAADAPAVPQTEDTPAVPQVTDTPAVPQVDELDTQMNNPSVDDPEVPVRFGAKAAIIKPSFIRATLKFDNEEGLPKPKSEDPMDPTSEGTGPGGKHKGGPKVLGLESIRIIKMGENFREGENFQELSGVKVVKPWNS